MLYFLCDNTFEGLLTCIFDAFYRKQFPSKIVSESAQIPLFSETFEVVTDTAKAERVLTGLKKLVSKSALEMLYICSLSEDADIETHIFNYIRKTFEEGRSMELNFADADVLTLSKMYRKVLREEERIRQFVRFQKTADGIFFAAMEPKYNVLRLCTGHFQERFADQQWIIYDVKRRFGLHYNLKKVTEITFDDPDNLLASGKLLPSQMDMDEEHFQMLWKHYFKSAAIKERTNLKLQRQFMPKRFWKYLIEKQ